MECQHCVSSVMEALNAVDGVTARVNLSKGNAKVSCDRVVSEDELRCAIERAGFQVISIIIKNRASPTRGQMFD